MAAKSDGVTHLICEISSQAQKLYRTYGIDFDVACFTNLGVDHIGPNEHADMEEYFLSKASLLKNSKTSVVNISDEYGARLYNAITAGKRVSYAIDCREADLFSGKINIGAYGCDFKVYERGKRVGFPMVVDGGAYNAENALCAASVCRTLGVSESAVMRGVLKTNVAGRGEIIESSDGRCTVIVDYAHNEMSFEAILKSVRKRFKGAMVSVVFGCPGDKAQCRRKGMAKVCARLADRVVFCEDDCGYEGYTKIKDEMYGYFREAVSEVKGRLSMLRISFIEERTKAITHVTELAADSRRKNVILLLGKGDEDKNRGCGCDLPCEKDIVIAKKAMINYDMLDRVSDETESPVLIVLENEKIAKVFFAQAERLIRKGLKLVALCKKNEAFAVRDGVYSAGIAVSVHSAYHINGTVFEIAKSEIRMGVLPVFTVTGAINKAVKVLFEGFLPRKVVYLSKNTSIISGDEIKNRKISLRALKMIAGEVNISYFEEAEAVIEKGAEEFAVINGENAYALTEYLCGGRSDGTVIRRKRF